MSYAIFVSFCLFLIINLRSTDHSLLSRFRNPNEYVASEPEKLLFLEDLDDKLYEDLLLEVPELRGKLRRGENQLTLDYPMLPFIRNPNGSTDELAPNHEEFDTDKDAPEEYPGQLDYVRHVPTYASTIANRMPFLVRPKDGDAGNSIGQNLTRILPWISRYTYRNSRCYWCGLNHPTRLPENTICADAFESPDWRARTLARYFRVHCHYYSTNSREIRPYWYSENLIYYTDRGLIRKQFGRYIGGCFKRFLDVGKMYTQRGCRAWLPRLADSANFVTHRYRRLEALIRRKKNYCIVSPHASLTPFSRAISLYVRYHVCVCSGRFCNRQADFRHSAPLILTSVVFALYKIYCWK